MEPVSGWPGVEDVAWLGLDEPSSVGAARRAAEELADRLGLPEGRVADVGLAVTEIATNVHRHGGGGAVLLRATRTVSVAAVEVVAIDSGVGITDMRAARQDGSSTAGGLGIGLGAIDRLADSLEISSSPGRGTVLVARFGPRGRGTGAAVEPPDADAAGITRPLSGEQVCGDAHAVRTDGSKLLLMLCDGSGHGPLAAAASQAAVRSFLDDDHFPSPPEDAVRRIHAALTGTRGGAVAVAELDHEKQTVRFVGVGNIAGAVLRDGGRRSMVSIGGVAGYRAPTIRTFTYPMLPGAVVVLTSDGVRTGWDASVLLGVEDHSPLLLAATLLRDAGVRHDDAAVLVGRVGG
jgi:anti-sigma regulatory factor (Ser/Thr protein kinase)